MKWVYLYLTVLAAHLLAQLEVLPTETAWVSKLLLMPVLLVAVATTNYKNPGPWRASLLVALGLSWVGDTLLVFEDPLYFGLGLAAFGLAHVAFIMTFQKARDDVHQIALAQKYMLLTLGILVFGIAIFMKLKGGLGSFMIPVALYILVLCIALVYAINRYGMCSLRSFGLVLTGTLFFVLSDTLLAFNHFEAWTFNNAGFWVLLTYGMAQLCIVLGIRRYGMRQA